MNSGAWKLICTCVGLAVLFAGCGFKGGDGGNGQGAGGDASQQSESVHIPGDLTYQDVLQKGGYVHVVGMSDEPVRVWLGTRSGLYASASGGLWTLVSPDLAEDEVTGWYVDPAHPNVIQIGGKEGSKRSEDGGATWETTGKGLPANSDIHSLTGGSAGGKSLLFAYVANEGIYRSVDRGDTWEKWMAVDREVLDMEYASAEDQLYIMTQDGILSNTGESWSREHLPDVQQFYSLAYNAQEAVLYVCTDQGVWKKDGQDWKPLAAKAPERMVMIGAGAGSFSLVAAGESADLYTLGGGVWKKWQ